MTIKLTKVKAGFYTAEDTKYMKNITVTGTGSRWTIKADGCYISIPNLKSAVAEIIEYNEARERADEEESRELAERMARYEAYRVAEAEAAETFKNVESVSFEVGTIIFARFASLNKNDTLGSYRVECDKPKTDEANRYWSFDRKTCTHGWVYPTNWSDDKCKITDVVELTEEGYDEFALNLLNSYDWAEGKGGCDSDDPRLADVEDHYNMTEDQQTIWFETMYRMVIAVTAPNRETVFVDPQGYSYARYVGLMIK